MELAGQAKRCNSQIQQHPPNPLLLVGGATALSIRKNGKAFARRRGGKCQI